MKFLKLQCKFIQDSLNRQSSFAICIRNDRRKGQSW